MCGIVGLFLKQPDLRPQLGALTAKMLAVMNDRGPDSAGFAVYGEEVAGHCKITVRLTGDLDAATLAERLRAAGTHVARQPLTAHTPCWRSGRLTWSRRGHGWRRPPRPDS